MDNFNFTDLHMVFTLKRIVFVNSANHAYSEIMLDNHMAMFGRNNAGKTASLAATKLLLFPETDFRECEKKFRFEGKAGMYGCEDSYKFYFPHPKSFLVLEVENPSGIFCMVLYRSSAMNSFGYHRLFVPVAYEHIRSQFWDSDKEDFAEQLSVESLTSFMKQHDGIGVTEQRRLIDLMFGSLGRADGRFCIVPLKDCGSDSIHAFKNIYNLAFASGSAESAVLPSAIAALIEMQRGRKEEKLDNTLTEVYERYLQLFKQGEELDLYEGQYDRFQSLLRSFEALCSNVKSYSHQYHKLKSWYVQSLDSFVPKIKSADQQYDQAMQLEMSIKNEVANLDQQCNQLTGSARTKERELEKSIERIKKCQAIMGRYPDHSIEDIITIYYDEQKKVQDILKALESEEEITKLFQAKSQSHKQKSAQLSNLRAMLADQSNLLMNQIDPHSIQVLPTLNKNLSSINLIIDDSEKEAIQNFTQLFKTDPDHKALYFKDQLLADIPFISLNPTEHVEAIKQREERLSEDVDSLDGEITELKNRVINFKNKELTEADRKRLSKDVSDIQADIDRLKGYEYLVSQQPEQKSELQELNDQLDKLTSQRAFKQEEYEKTSEQVQYYQSVKEELGSLKSNYEAFEASLNSAKSSYEPIPPQLLSEIKDSEFDEDITSIKAKMELLIKQAIRCDKDKSVFENDMGRFMEKVPQSNIEPDKLCTTLTEWAINIDIYKSSFENLAFKRNDFHNEVRRHNEDIRQQIAEINEASEQLHRTVNLINQKLNGHRISNLSEIKLHLETTSDFNSIKNTLSKHSISGNTLPEKEFYTSLLRFFEAHQNRRTGRIKMVDLIKSIAYRYTINGSQVMTKSQSGGTTSTVTAFVLSVLLNEIKMTDTIVRMPIIVDEISTLDPANSQATIQQISDQGFSIFCATPAFNAHIASEVGRFIFIDKHTPPSIRVEGCEIHILPQHITVFGETNEAES